jgi:4-hydroxysphinganine ceramide fatty acyl 2-hydroxylase
VIPTVWLPPVCYGLYLASEGLNALGLVAFFCLGLMLWTLIEYIMHRFLFHLD